MCDSANVAGERPCLTLRRTPQSLVGAVAQSALALDLAQSGAAGCGRSSVCLLVPLLMRKLSTQRRGERPAGRVAGAVCCTPAGAMRALSFHQEQAAPIDGHSSVAAAVAAVAAEVRENVKLRRASWCADTPPALHACHS